MANDSPSADADCKPRSDSVVRTKGPRPVTVLSRLDLHDADHGESRRSGVIERVTLVMEVFGPHRQSARLEEIAERSGLPRSTAFRILRQLVNLGWLEHGADGFRLGKRLRKMHGCTLDYTDIRAAASPVLTELNLKTAAVCHLAVPDGSFVHYLDKIGGAAAHSVPSRVGARLGADETVSGLAILAQLTPEDVDQRYADDRRKTTRDGMRIEHLHMRLERVRRRRGIAFSDASRCGMGISSIAAPVLGPDGAVAAISLAAYQSTWIETLGPVVAAAAKATSARLFHHWGTDQLAR